MFITAHTIIFEIRIPWV